MINNQKIRKIFSSLLMLLATTATFAQDTEFPIDVVDNPSPIDTNLWVLILVGLGYVFYKYRKSGRYNRL
ncbi:hypothetical protein MCEGE10_00513 [Flavobacteriaceae bacterium]